ncbi:prepilin-type N-terminal cleavage/methylation domain-containing protein, partial [Microgenomates group bacterium]|nr:prepilin-type N-terminal cleavage/methylation domain-containing protein [Microgenomates group bacterium]
MKRLAGFTFIELLIALMISGILFSGGIAAYRGIGVRQDLKQAGIEFQSNLRLIQEKTLSSKKPTECDVLLGYEVSYVDDNTYSMKPVCQNGASVSTDIDLQEGISFGGVFSKISFFVLKAEITGAQTITLTSSSLQYQVIIESSGVIRGGML